MTLDEINTSPKKPNEKFSLDDKALDFTIVDFWSWSQSDLIENRNRGILAEFLVKQALGIKSKTRLEWDAYDLETEEGIKIEVKSAAFIQAWKQNKLSTIKFDIKPTKTLLPDNNYSDTNSRQSNVYIFCLLHHKDQQTINPMNLEQWTFYLVSTKTVDENFPKQQSISISTIETIPHEKCTFSELASRFKKIRESIPSLI